MAARLSSSLASSCNGCNRELDHSTIVLGDGPAGGFYFTEDCALNGHVGFLNLEDDVVSNNYRHRDVEIIGDGQTVRMEGTLDITIHHARDILNICIYGKQDVYAKFALTNSKDVIFSTQPVRGGGKNPVFNESLRIPVTEQDARLKCEIWMMSCAQNYLEDQLLGFVLVPLANLVGKGRLTQDYVLTSTELFHTPAGMVRLSLTFNSRHDQQEASHYEDHYKSHADVSSIRKCHDVMLVDFSDQNLTPTDYNKIEFPDLLDVSENQHMFSVYLNMTSGDLKLDSESNSQVLSEKKRVSSVDLSAQYQALSETSFLHLGSSPMTDLVDYEMASNTGDKDVGDFEGVETSRTSHLFNITSSCGNGSVSHVEALLSSSASVNTLHDLGENKTGNDQEQRRSFPSDVSISAVMPLQLNGPNDATGKCLSRSTSISNEKIDTENKTATCGNDESAATQTHFVAINLEPKERIVQQQIVDLYMKSMQQFTESLAKMKLPLDIDPHDQAEPINAKAELKNREDGNIDGHRVFYGSGAFF